MESMIQRVITSAPLKLGESLAFAVCSSADQVDCSVSPEEEHLPSVHSSEKKKSEFMCGREAARLALREVGFEGRPVVLRGTGGEPVWPKGIAGSISHCCPWSVAVVIKSSNDLSAGIDLENIGRLRDVDISSVICSDEELRWVREGDARGRLLMVFSAKEAIYKALYPIYQRYVDFKEVELFWSDDQCCFHAEFLSTARPGLAPESLGPVYCHIASGFICSCFICPRN